MSTWSPKARTVQAFTEGDCWALALEVRRLTGLPLVVTSEYDDPDTYSEYFGWDHVAVILPDDMVLDVHGLTPLDTWKHRWNSNGTITVADSETVRALTDDQERRFPDANPRATARRLLNHFNIPTTGRRHRDALPR